MNPGLDIPLRIAAPAVAASLAYLNAKWSVFYDWHLLGALVRIILKSRWAEHSDRMNLFYVLEKHALASSTANHPFIVYNGRTWTFHETYQTALRHGQFFKTKFGIKPKEIVAMDFMNSANFVFVWMGLWSIGAVPAFINYNLSGKPLTHSVKVSSAKLLIVDEEVRDRFPPEQLETFASPDFRDGKGPVEVVFFTPDLEAQILQTAPIREDDSARSGPIGRDMAMLIYTSGTTGLPKPAIVSWNKSWAGGTFITKWISLKKTDRVFTVGLLFSASEHLLAQSTDVSSVCLSTTPRRRYWPFVPA